MTLSGEGRERSETLAARAKSKGCKANSEEREAKSEGRGICHYVAVKNCQFYKDESHQKMIVIFIA